jgi:hypothetical protein
VPSKELSASFAGVDSSSSQLVQNDYCNVTSGEYECCDTTSHACVSEGGICDQSYQECVPYYTTYDPDMPSYQALCLQWVCQGTSAMTQLCFNNETNRGTLLAGMTINSSQHSYLYEQCNNICVAARNSTTPQCKLQVNYSEVSPSDALPTQSPTAVTQTTGQTTGQSSDPNYCAISTGGFTCCNITAGNQCKDKAEVCSYGEGCVEDYLIALPGGMKEFWVDMICISKGSPSFNGSYKWRWEVLDDRELLLEGFLIGYTGDPEDIYSICKKLCGNADGVEAQCSFGVMLN